MKPKDINVVIDAIGEKGLQDILSGRSAVRNKKSLGSTNPKLVAKVMKQEEKWLKTAYSDLTRARS